LQPILVRMGQAIQTVAMTPGIEREQVLARELERLREDLETRQAEGLELDQYLTAGEPLLESVSPVTLSDLERLLTWVSSLTDHFQPHPELQRAYWLETDEGDAAVTFDAALFDAHPNTLRLLTYGSELLTTLLDAVPEPASNLDGRVLRCLAEGPLPLCAYYALDARGCVRCIERVTDLEVAYTVKPPADVARWSEETEAAARSDFQRQIEALLQRRAAVIAARHRAERLALEKQARQILLHTALVELAMGQQPSLFDDEVLPVAFTEAAVTGLGRHGYPFAPLLRLVKVNALRPSPTDQFYTDVQGKSREALRGSFKALGDKAARLVGLLASAADQEEPCQDLPEVVVQTSLF